MKIKLDQIETYSACRYFIFRQSIQIFGDARSVTIIAFGSELGYLSSCFAFHITLMPFGNE